MTTSAMTPPATAGAVPHHLRSDIQGLRAVSVVAVILDHAVGWPSGGFIGVDVFFVISGFLITGLMLREYERSGHISWIGFYRRRIRRIMPGASATLTFTVIVSIFLFYRSRSVAIAKDAVWSFLFASNWHFAQIGTDYFQQSHAPSPLQHFWSLAVEEQFYIVWPLLMIVILGAIGGLLGRRNRSAMPLLAAAIGVITAASFVWAMHETQQDPTFAYFSTFSRAWELGAGALLAICGKFLFRLPPVVRSSLSWIGLAGIVLSFLVIGSASAVPAPAAALPVLCAVLVIAAGLGQTAPHLWVLTNNVAGYVGKISYSLYLWHFPVIVLLAAVMPDGTFFYSVLALSIIFALAVASFHLIEDPVRKSSWLTAKAQRKSRRLRGAARTRGVWAASFVLLAVVVGVGAYAWTRSGSTAAASSPITGKGHVVSNGQLTAAIGSAVRENSWPADLASSLNNPSAGEARELITKGCLSPKDLNDADQCLFGAVGAPRTAIVVGDSVAISWLPGIREVLQPLGYRIHGIGVSNCPFANVLITLPTNPAEAIACNKSHGAVYDQIKKAHPDIVIVSDVEGGIQRLQSRSTGAVAEAEWSAGLEDALRRVSAAGTTVVVLAPNPAGPAVNDCATKVTSPRSCTGVVSNAWITKSHADAAGARAAGANYVNTSTWFCTANSLCPVFAAGMLIRWDGIHLTSTYARYLGSLIAAALRQPTS